MRRLSLLLLVLTTSLPVVACSSGSDDDDASKGTGSGAITCTLTRGDELVYCYAFGSGYTASSVSTICDETGSVVGKRVSSCPAGDVVGTCSTEYPSGATTYRYDWTFYNSTGVTCESAKQTCAGFQNTAAGASSTFVGNGC